MRRHSSLPAAVFLALVLSALGTALPAGAAVPGPAVNLVAFPQSTNAVKLTWLDTSSNETRFRVEKATASGPFVLARNVGANKQQVVIGGLPQGTYMRFRVRSENSDGPSAWSSVEGAYTDRNVPPSNCFQTQTRLCLGRNSSRFQIDGVWREPGGGSLMPFQATELNADNGYLWFFEPGNVEVVVKILNACGPTLNNRYWVFAGGVTNVETVITVTDTQAGKARTYFNPLGRPFQPVQDTNGFATCP